MIHQILERANIQSLREFLLCGADSKGNYSGNYKQRLNDVYDKQRNIVNEYDSLGEESRLHNAIGDILYDYENIYMELGIRAGFSMAKDLEKTLLKDDTATYREMYLVLFSEATKALEILKNAQANVEEIYIKASKIKLDL